MNLPQLILFSIRVQRGEGLMGKSPEWIQGQYQKIRSNDAQPEDYLEGQDLEEYNEWFEKYSPVNEVSNE